MNRLALRDPAILLGLQDEIRRSDDSRYDHRLHGLLLVAQGMSCRKAAGMLGDSPRTVQYWVTRFETDGLQGIAEGERKGRPARLTKAHKAAIGKVLRGTPEEIGLAGALWDGNTLSAYIAREYKVKLGVRQCQRLFRQLKFRLRKPRPVIASADPERQVAYKKTP
jgi:transposase